MFAPINMCSSTQKLQMFINDKALEWRKQKSTIFKGFTKQCISFIKGPFSTDLIVYVDNNQWTISLLLFQVWKLTDIEEMTKITCLFSFCTKSFSSETPNNWWTNAACVCLIGFWINSPGRQISINFFEKFVWNCAKLENSFPLTACLFQFTRFQFWCWFYLEFVF